VKRFFAILMAFFLVISGLPIYTANAAAYDPVTKTQGDATLDLRFWEDQKPDIGFYINAGNRYLLENVKAPKMGTSSGEWSVMDLLRGSYLGADYLNYLPANYYEDYFERINQYVILKDGILDKNKSTEWSRLTLAMSSLGKDIRSIGTPGKFIKTKEAKVSADGGYEFAHYAKSDGLGVLEVINNQFTLEAPTGILFEYTNRNNKPQSEHQILAPGTYTINDDYTVTNEQGEQVSFLFEEKSGNKVYGTHTLTKIPNDGIINVEKPYDFVETLSTSYTFAQKQGTNGPIWVLIALNTGGYTLYSEEELNARGITVGNTTVTINKVKYPVHDLNTEGRMIDLILQREVTNNNGRVGGWALSGKNPDPDITMMAIQGLVPYYFDEAKFKKAYEETIDLSTIDLTVTDTPTAKYYDLESESFKQKYIEFKKAVERAVMVMAEDQLPTGGFKSMGNPNSESIVQVIVGLTALGINPLSDSVHLPTINQTVSFIKEGGTYDGVWSNNMIDALTAFWAMGSGSSSEVSGFKHVSTGSDSGGGAGTTVNAMATDQVIYGLIAYDRFLKKEKHLYDMTDMINGEYKTMKAKEHAYTYMIDNEAFQQGTFSPYEVLTIPEPPAKDGFNAVWTTQADGTGAVYKAGERLSTPDHPITLYAQYVVPYEITYELNDGQWVKEDAEEYAPATRALTLPTADHIQKENHVFYGWYTTADFQGDAVKTLSDSAQLQHTLYAKWVSHDQLIQEAIIAIESLPDEADISLANIDNVEAVRAVYDLVPQQLTEKVTNYTTLTRAEDVLAILSVEAQIDALPETINLTHENIVNEATTAFNRLSGNLQVEVKNVGKMNIAREKLQTLTQQATDLDHAASVRTLITSLPEQIELTHLTKIKAARVAYDALTEKQKSYLTYDLPTLEAKELKIAQLVKKQATEQMAAAMTLLPETDKLTLKDQDNVFVAYELYKALPTDSQAIVDTAKLFAAVAKIIDLQINALPTTIAAKDQNTLETIRSLYTTTESAIQKLVKDYAKLEKKFEDLANSPNVEKANEVIAKINVIPTTVSTTSKAAITAARVAYDALNADDKVFVTNYAKLTTAESTLQALEAQETVTIATVSAQISLLPNTVTLADKANVNAIYNTYQTLSATAKLKVTNAAKLLSAYTTLTTLEAQNKQIVQAIQTALTALPASITLQHQAVIEDARKKYDSLTAEQKALVNTTKLVEAEKQLQVILKNVDQNQIKQITKEQLKEHTGKVEITLPIQGAIISQQLLASITQPTIDIQSATGLTISLPTVALRNIHANVHLETKAVSVNNRPAFEINISKEKNGKLETAKVQQAFTVRIPDTKFIGRTASLQPVVLKNGVILAYNKEDGYSAVPHIYKDGEYIVTLTAGQTLVYSNELKTFEDVANNGSRAEIEYLATRYVIQGYEDDTFRPNKAITRAQFASLVSRALGLQPTNTTTITDIKNSAHKDAIQALAETGIMTGDTTTGKFNPNNLLTREHAALVMTRVLEYLEVDAKGSIVHYTDKSQINENYLTQIGLLNRLDIMTGRTDGSFGPKEFLTRAQLAKILQRTLAFAEVL